ncbi:integrin alpha-4-like [Saccostrea cucullata]|uniref:integrin alpha-4-like n=1 Tax=Saccostrea cuccullata TaxID=36930 RepID=UPI002ED0D49E
MNWIMYTNFRKLCFWSSVFVWFIVLTTLLSVVTCYNVDIERPLIFYGKPGSYFGATAEIVVDSKKWLLVGATKDNFTDRPEIPYPGNVYACPIDFHSQSSCIVLPSLRTGENHANESQNVFEQKEQLLGATILVPEDKMKAIKICAPNWKNLRFFNPNDNVDDYYQVTGNCFLLKNRSDLVNKPEVSKFRIPPDVLDFYKAPLIGFSLSDIKTPVFETFYGAPNVGRSSTGGIVGKNDGTLKSVTSLKLEVERSEVIKNTYLTGSLFGYSIATGQLGQNPFHFVVGAPGFSNKNGNIGAFSVFILGAPPVQVKQIEGNQVGGGFGQTLCIADVNGDKNDEILVAAPNWFSMDDQGNKVLNDIGSVYIYYGTGTSAIIDDMPQILHGSFSPFSRFGTAIANIGDINKDGYNDIAIGAPFENIEGAVYIFNGGKTRLEDKYSQKITGSRVKPGLQGFGWYISRSAMDVDDNMYNDFAVGAYKSDTALILRSRNIIDINCDITTNPDRIPLNASGISCSDGRDFNPCFSVSFCFNFSGDGIKDTGMKLIDHDDTSFQEELSQLAQDETSFKEELSQLAQDETSFQEELSQLAQDETSFQEELSQLAQDDTSFQEELSQLAQDETSFQEELSQLEQDETYFKEDLINSKKI